VIPGAVTSRAEGRAAVREGRSDLAFQQALDEALRQSLLEALAALAPDRQSARDFELWQRTLLPRAREFVGAYRILSQDEKGGFLQLAVEVEIYREKLLHAARASATAPAAQPLRLLVLADALPVADPAADEEIDAGGVAIASLEAELARRGAIILSTANRSPWQRPGRAASDESREALAVVEGKRLQADGVLVVRLTRRGDTALELSVELVAVAAEATAGAAHAVVTLAPGQAIGEAFLPATRQIAGSLAPRLAGVARGARPGGGSP
jgi:hypothetical protein